MTQASVNEATPARGMESVATAGDSLSGMAVLGKTAISLLVVVAAILLLAWLVRRFNLHSGAAGQHLRVVGSVAVGQRERVVLVEVDKTWLVLGVGGGQVTRLHELPAQESAPTPAASESPTGGFAQRLAQVLARAQQPRNGAADPTRPAPHTRRSDGPSS